MRRLALIVSLGLSFTLSSPVTVMADTVQLREDAPDRHVVVKGDTLWDISAKFLKSPWLWPDLWQTNKDHIKNPHLIYPGDVVYLVMTPDGPRLEKVQTVKLSPQVHAEAIEAQDAIPAIPHAAIRAFLQRPLVEEAGALSGAPKLIATQDGRGLVMLGDRVYADHIAANQRNWHIVRVGKALKRPGTNETLAREVEYIGNAQLQAKGAPATLVVAGAVGEIMMGDRLVPATQADTTDFVPHAPAKPVDGRVISAFGGSQASHRYATIVIDQGRADGLEPGHVLAVARPGKTVGRAEDENRVASFNPKNGYLDGAKERGHNQPYVDLMETARDDTPQRWRYMDTKCLKADAPAVIDGFYDPAQMTEECKGDGSDRKVVYMDIGCLKPGKQVSYDQPFDPKDVYELHCREPADQPGATRLPDSRAGLILVYRVFDKVSYALVMESYGPIYLLDRVGNP